MKLILIIGIGILICFIFFYPIIEVWKPDNEIYGNIFCETYDNSCINTEGHYTKTKVNLLKYLIKYRGLELGE